MGIVGSVFTNRGCSLLGGIMAFLVGLLVTIMTGELIQWEQEWQIFFTYFGIAISSTTVSLLFFSFLIRLLFGKE